MNQAVLRSLLSLVVLAALALGAPAAGAQATPDLLRERELRGAPPRLVDAIGQLRPHWVQPGDTAGFSRVAVFVNGRHVGDARVLHGMATDQVVSVRLRTAQYVRRTDPRFPRVEFDHALYVTTRARGERAASGRFTLSFEGSVGVRSLSHAMSEALEGAGYDRKVLVTEWETYSFESKETALPVGVGGSLHYALPGPWGVAATAQHARTGWSGGYSDQHANSVSATIRSIEGAVLVTREAGIVRAGVGPALRKADVEWVGGWCQCILRKTSSMITPGAAAEALVALPLRGRFFPTARVLARYYPAQEAEYQDLREPVEVGGLVVSLGIGLSTRF